jgi:hypothetical protein
VAAHRGRHAHPDRHDRATLALDASLVRWLNIIAAVFLVVFNIAGLPYPGAYDNLLILVSLVFNALTAWYAWNWLT